MDWWMDLLTTCTCHSELQVITAPLLISTIHRSPQHPWSLFPACCVFNSCSLATASSSGDSSASHAHVITVQRISHNWTLVNCRLNCQPSTNWVPGWRLFRTNLVVFSSQTDFQLTTELVNLIALAWTTLKTPFYYFCTYLFLREHVYQAYT
jgi:hypothetical protein